MIVAYVFNSPEDPLSLPPPPPPRSLVGFEWVVAETGDWIPKQARVNEYGSDGTRKVWVRIQGWGKGSGEGGGGEREDGMRKEDRDWGGRNRAKIGKVPTEIMEHGRQNVCYVLGPPCRRVDIWITSAASAGTRRRVMSSTRDCLFRWNITHPPTRIVSIYVLFPRLPVG